MVWLAAVSSSPTRTHTFNPGVEQPAESLQRHSLVWSERNETNDWQIAKYCALSWIVCNSGCPYHHRSPTCDSWCSLLCCAPATCRRCSLLSCGSSSYTAAHAFCTHSEGLIFYWQEKWSTSPKMNWWWKNTKQISSSSNAVTQEQENQSNQSNLQKVILMISSVNIRALEGHFADTFSSGRLLPGFTLHQGRDMWLCRNDCGIHRNHSSTLLND